jgi:thiosulfate dehydrogenase [quinone] large subunit
LFSTDAAAWPWLVVRLYVGYEWLEAGPHRFSHPRWMGDGTALLG